MSPEEIYAELEKLTHKIGELDENLVAQAVGLLAHPRYLERSNPRELLAADLKRVIEAIPGDPVPGEDADALAQMRRRVRLHFSMDEPGTNITHRKLVDGEPGGRARTWITIAVLNRVVAGLIALWADTGDGASEAGAKMPSPYTFDSVRITRKVDGLRRMSRVSEEVAYKFASIAPGTHLLVAPLHPTATRLLSKDGDSGDLKFQLIHLAGNKTGVIIECTRPFSGGQSSVELTRSRPPSLASTSLDVCCKVEQPTRSLWLSVFHSANSRYRWELSIDGEIFEDAILESMAGHCSWHTDRPVVGSTYRLKAVTH